MNNKNYSLAFIIASKNILSSKTWYRLMLFGVIYLIAELPSIGQLVQGTVYDICTGQTVEGQIIRISDLNGQNSYTVTTGSDGTYSVNVGGGTISNFFRIRTDGTNLSHIIVRGPGIIAGRNFYVLPGISGLLTITTCDILRDPRCGEPTIDENDNLIQYFDRYEKKLSTSPVNAPPIGCDANWSVIGPQPGDWGQYSYRVEIYNGILFNTLVGVTDWVCNSARYEVQCEPHGIDVRLGVNTILSNLTEGVYKVRLVQSCCKGKPATTFTDGYMRWIPNVVPVNVDFKFTASTLVEQTNGDAEINGQLDQCFTTLPGAQLGGISGGLVFNDFSQNNAVEWSKVEIREVDCILGDFGPIIFSKTWVTLSGSQPNPFSFAEVREDQNDLTSAPYFLNSTNVDGKCFALTFSAKNACTTAEQTQYFTVPTNLIFHRPSLNEDEVISEDLAVKAKVYPSPFGDELFISLIGNGFTEGSYIELWDSHGRLVFTQQVAGIETTLRIQTDQLSSGLYIYRVHQKDGIISGKVIK